MKSSFWESRYFYASMCKFSRFKLFEDKCDYSIILKTATCSIIRYGKVRCGDAGRINSIEILYKLISLKNFITLKYNLHL